jgi:GH25 family lysozyme M1 (1,4-beta-N-acetylmuramidase)
MTLGLDLSRFNYSADGSIQVDFDAIKNNPEKVEFVAVRSGISWGYADAWFARSWSELKRVDIPRMAYHVFYFGESPQAQVDNMFRIIGDYDEHDRFVIDLEVAGTNSKAHCTATTKVVLEIIKARTGRYPICYSRAGWVNDNLYANQLPVVDWWLAQYLTRRPYPLFTPEKTPPPDLPNYVNTWLIHQTAEYTPSVGVSGRRYMDYNRWNGTSENVRAYFGYSEVVQPPLTCEEQLADHERRISALEGG